jgi:DNA-binding transcriptional MocR family regulator
MKTLCDVTNETTQPVDPELTRRIAATLRQHKIISLRKLSRELGSDRNTVRDALHAWIQEGRVECLKPTGFDEAVHRGSSRELDLIYYRWRQKSDRNYLWQRELAAPPPACMHPHPDSSGDDHRGSGNIRHREHGVLHLLWMHIAPRTS